MNQPQLFDAGKLVGAALLCFVLGSWISLVHKNTPRTSASTAMTTQAPPASRASTGNDDESKRARSRTGKTR